MTSSAPSRTRAREVLTPEQWTMLVSWPSTSAAPLSHIVGLTWKPIESSFPE
jgi:hypothetical protein